MQVTARGWGRNSGPKMIMATDLEDGYQTDKRTYYAHGKTYVRKGSIGVEIRKGPCEFTLGGKYLVSVSLSKDDILRLFVEAFRDGISFKAMGIMKDHAEALGLSSDEDDEDDD